MEAKFIKSGKVIKSKAAELFVRLGLAEEISDVEHNDQTPENEPAEVIQSVKRTNKKPATKKRGRQTKRK